MTKERTRPKYARTDSPSTMHASRTFLAYCVRGVRAGGIGIDLALGSIGGLFLSVPAFAAVLLSFLLPVWLSSAVDSPTPGPSFIATTPGIVFFRIGMYHELRLNPSLEACRRASTARL